MANLTWTTGLNTKRDDEASFALVTFWDLRLIESPVMEKEMSISVSGVWKHLLNERTLELALIGWVFWLVSLQSPNEKS